MLCLIDFCHINKYCRDNTFIILKKGLFFFFNNFINQFLDGNVEKGKGTTHKQKVNRLVMHLDGRERDQIFPFSFSVQINSVPGQTRKSS